MTITANPPKPAADTFTIAIADDRDTIGRQILAAAVPSPEWRLAHPADGSRDAALAAVAGAAAIVTRRRMIDAELLAAAGRGLRLVQIQGHLADRVDLAAAQEAGVPVAVMPSRGCIAVAEHAIALMLALARRIVPGHTGVVAGGYRQRGLTPAPTSERSFAFNWLADASVSELQGKTLGVVGFGEIGQEVARRAAAFGMRIRYWSRRQLAPVFEQQLRAAYRPLETLLAESDFVSLHLPHTTETERLLDASRLAAMKPTARIVNTSRGGIVDESALVAALREHRLAGAGLDVFVAEPLPFGHPLTTLDNVVLTPHVGGGAGGGQRGHARDVFENVGRALRGEAIRHRVTSLALDPVEDSFDV